MTSLAQQLRRLAVPHTQSIFGEDKFRASLLFDPKEAALLDRAAVYAIGYGGLEELQNVDKKFVSFEESLFSDSSQNWERSLQSEEVNQDLNTTIREFLILLSPYFPLKSAHKAMEWLIYRYHIHQYNKEDMILCVLPYHEMKIFVRVLQLLKLDNAADKWHWLAPGTRQGIPLARGTLINHCKKDPGFMAFILEIVPSFIKIHGPENPQLRAVIAFYLCAILGALKEKRGINEKIMSIILPHLVIGFRSKCAEFRAANLMVLSQLCIQVKLKEETFQSLLPVMSKRMSSFLTEESLGCLAVIFQTQSLAALPKKTFKHMCKVPGIILLLSSLSVKYDMDALISAWVKRLIPKAMINMDEYSSSSDGGNDGIARPMYGSLLHGVITDVKFSAHRVVCQLTKDVLVALMDRRLMVETAEDISGWKSMTNTLLLGLENRFSDAFEASVQELYSGVKGDEFRASVLKDMMTLTSSPVCYQMVSDTSTSLVLGLKHHSSTVRTLTLAHLEKYLQEQHTAADKSLVSSLLLERLTDDSPKVVASVLKLKKYLLEYAPRQELVPILLSLVKGSCTKEKWSAVNRDTIRLLCQCADDYVSLELLPYLLIVTDAGMAELLIKEGPPLIKDITKSIKKEWCELNLKSGFSAKQNVLVIYCLANFLANSDSSKEKVGDFVEKSKSSPNMTLLLVLALTGMTKIEAVRNDVDLMMAILDHLVTMVQTICDEHSKLDLKIMLSGNVSELGIEQQLRTWTAFLKKYRCQDMSLAVYVTDCMVSALQQYTVTEESVDFICDFERASPVIRLLNLLMEKSLSGDVWRAIVIRIIAEVPLGTLLPVFHYIWMMGGVEGAPVAVSPHLHVGSFHLFKRVLNNLSQDDLSQLCAYNSRMFISLVLSLSHQVDCIPSITQVLTMMKVACKSLHKTRALILKKLIGRPHVPHLVLKKLFNTLLKQDKKQHKVYKADLQDFLDLLGEKSVPNTAKLRIMKLLGLVHPQVLLDTYIPLALRIIRSDSTEDYQLLKPLFEKICQSFEQESQPKCAEVLFEALKYNENLTKENSPQTLALDCLDSQLFKSLGDLELQKRLVSCLLDIGEHGMSHDLANQVHACLKGLHIQCRHIKHELCRQEEGITTIKAKRLKTPAAKTMTLNYQRLTFLLEVVHSCKKIKDREDLVTALSAVLRHLLEETASETEYCKQLILTVLLRICSQWNSHTKPARHEVLEIENIVKCIRTSASPQTQQQALMVMTAIAPLYPEYILHHVMSIFTFMGSNMLQQDDAYSFQIITKTLDTIIPALIQACADKNIEDTDETALIQNILRVFVDARRHIPKHRCTVLFKQLAERVGVQRHLWTVVVLQMESAVRTKDVPTVADTVVDVTEEGKSSIQKDIDLVFGLVSQFDVSVQLHTMTELNVFLTKLARYLMHEQAQLHHSKSKGTVTVPIITTQSLTSQQLRLLQFHMTRLITIMINSPNFVNTIKAQLSESEMTADLQDQFQQFVEQCLSLLTAISRGHGAPGNSTTTKFWRASLLKVYEVLEKINYLLPNSVFLTVISALLNHDILVMRRKSIELLNNKMQMITVDQLTPPQTKALLDLVPRLLNIVQESPQPQDVYAEHVTLRQMILYSLKLICKLLGSTHPDYFSQLFGLSLAIINAPEEPVPVLGGALLCLGELCSSLRARALPYLPKFMPPLLSLLRNNSLLKENELLLVCSLTALQKLVGSLPHFLSPYLLDVLACVCQIAANMELTDSNRKTQPVIRLKVVRHQLATAIPARVLVPKLLESLDKLISLDQSVLLALLEIAQQHIENMEKDDLSSQHSNLISFFCATLDFRNTKPQLSSAELAVLEREAIQPIITMVMKLSENTFRPMFYKLYDWACRDDTEAHRNRRLAFFQLAERLSEKLKSLFNLFIGTIIKAACDQLNLNNTKHGAVTYYGLDEKAAEKSCRLLAHTIGCLQKCLLFDSEGLVTKEMFTSLLDPLVDQLENMIGGDAAYEERIISHVMPCISQLCVATKEDTSWKTLNYQVLLKTRHNSPKIRFATLQVIEDLANKLGDEYMALLPETVPFLAELMEDDSEEVEQKCQEVISSLESSLGESLKEYF